MTIVLIYGCWILVLVALVSVAWRRNTIQLIRSTEGKFRGLAIMRGNAIVLAGTGDHFWRICDCCTANEALVFCSTHGKYVCVHCLHWHGRVEINGPFVLGDACQVLSMASARSISEGALAHERGW